MRNRCIKCHCESETKRAVCGHCRRLAKGAEQNGWVYLRKLVQDWLAHERLKARKALASIGELKGEI